MLRNLLIVMLVCSVCVLALMSFFIGRSIGNSPVSSQVSSSGKYEMQYIRVSFPFTYTRYGYVRIIDLSQPKHAYRSPVIEEDVLEMRRFESLAKVGVYWLDFDKATHRFQLSFPDWHESWLNLFVSNAPCDVIPND